MFVRGGVLALVISVWSGCLIDPIGRARSRVRSGEQAIDRRDFAAAQRELDAAEGIAEDDVALRRRIRIARRTLERELVRARAQVITAAGSSTTIGELWSLRERNARSGGPPSVDELLVRKMRESVGLFLQDQEQLAASGRPGVASAEARGLISYPGVDDAIGGARRVTALAHRAASLHLARARALTASPLARRGHEGLAASYVGGSVSDATAMTAPLIARVDVRGTPAASCAELAAPIVQRLTRAGQGRRVEVELELTECRSQEDSETAVATATWTEWVPEPRRIEVSRQVCDYADVQTTTEFCTLVYERGRGHYNDCTGVRLMMPFYKCTNVTETVDTIVSVPVQRSAPRTVTTTKASTTVTGSYVVRKEGQPDRRGSINQALVRTDTSYPAVGASPAKDRVDHARVPAMLGEARDAIEAQLTTEIAAALAADVAAARTAAQAAAAEGRQDAEEEALIHAVLLGSDDVGALGARYGITAAQLRAVFATAEFAAPTRLVAGLPAEDAIPELTANERGEVERQVVTGLASPMTLPRWFTFGLAGFAQPERAAPDGAALLGAKGLAVSARAGAMLLGRLQGAGFGPLLVDDASVHVDGGFAVAHAADQIGGGTRLIVGADYTAALGWRTRRFGGVFAGLRATASYEALAGSSLTSLPLFARVELPLPTGSLTVEAFGRPIAGTTTSGVTAYVTGENRQRRDRSNLFFAVRVERGSYDASATYTTAAFEDLELEFLAVPVTTIGVELGAGF